MFTYLLTSAVLNLRQTKAGGWPVEVLLLVAFVSLLCSALWYESTRTRIIETMQFG